MALRSAGGPSSLDTTFRMPAALASCSRPGTQCVVNIISGVVGMIRLITRAVSNPFISGITRSRMMISGRRSWALTIPSRPFSASPHMIQPDSVSASLKRRRIRALSSTTRTDFTHTPDSDHNYQSRLCGWFSNQVNTVR
jgi:hypothetical protein